MRIEEELEGVRQVIKRLKERDDDIPIIVEGSKDKKALKFLGIKEPIIRIKKGDTIFHIIERMRGKYDEVIVLTDWDRTGGRLAHRIKKACMANAITCNEEHRLELIKHLKKEIKDVESLPIFIERAKMVINERWRGKSKS